MKVKRRRKKPATKRERVKKSPAKSPVATAAPIGALVPQEHGGALRNGSLPGTNAGGSGRPPSAIRAAFAESFDKRRYIYEHIADDGRESAGDRIRALDSMGRFGLGEKPLEVTDIRQHPDAQRFVAAFHQALSILPAVDAERVRAKVDELLMVLS